MPIELILLLLAFALVANAVLVVLAVRQMLDDPERRARRSASAARVDPTTAGDELAPPSEVLDPPATVGDGPAAEPIDTAGRIPIGPVILPPATTPAGPTANPEVAPRTRPAAEAPGDVAADGPPAASRPAPKRAAAAATGAAPRAKATPSRRSAKSRQPRFTLPAMTEDPERAERAIEAFLTGGRPPAHAHHHDAAAPRPKLRGGDRRSADTRTASVAIVAVTGYRGLLSGPAGDERGRAVDAAVETTLRRAARVGDHVVALGDGRFRILLVGSSESAANAYLDRVRTMCRPWLQAAAVPLDLVTAAAEAGDDGDLAQALRTAERRLVKAGERPRASGEDGGGR